MSSFAPRKQHNCRRAKGDNRTVIFQLVVSVRRTQRRLVCRRAADSGLIRTQNPACDDDGDSFDPSQRLGRTISSELEDAILACLEKNRSKCPQTARDLAHMLASFSEAQNWTENEADGWWSRHERGLPASQVNALMVAVPAPMTKSESPATGSGTSTKPPMTTPGFDQTMISNEID